MVVQSDSRSKPLAFVGTLALASLCGSASAAFVVRSPAATTTASAWRDRASVVRKRPSSQLHVSTTDELTSQEQANEEAEQVLRMMTETSAVSTLNKKGEMPDLVAALQKKIGTVDDDRLLFPELTNGEVPRLYSSLKYEKGNDGKLSAAHAAGSVVGAAALVSGTTIGAGVLALPTATAAAGFLPSSAALGIAWVYMTMSGLLIAELTMNRIGTSGKPGLGLLELYGQSLGENLGRLATAAYYFLHYAIMVAYIAQGGANLDGLLSSVGMSEIAAVPGVGQALFAGTCGSVLYLASKNSVEKLNNALVFGVVASFLGIVATGFSTADFGALVDPTAQHVEQVVNCFPIMFLSLVYQNIVPTVVTQLEGDRSKITNAIIGGTAVPFLMFLAFNAVVLGNSGRVDLTSGVDPVALLGSSGSAGLLGPLVGGFSSLAIITSLIGFTYGLLDAWTDTFGVPTEGKEFEKRKAALYALIFLPPAALSVANPDIFYNALDYAGAFGVSTLFLVLPPFMVWKERYGEDRVPLVTKPMVPFGKIPLGSMWKAAGTLILEQGAEKLGVFNFFSELWHQMNV